MTRPDSPSTQKELAPSGLAVLGEVAAYLASGVGFEEVLSRVAAALRRGLDLEECRIWIRTRESGSFRCIVPSGDRPGSDARAAEVAGWVADRHLRVPGDEGPRARIRLMSAGEALGLLEATLPDDASVDVGREVLQIACNILAPWLGSIELSEDLASEVAFRTREIEAHRRFTARIIDSLPLGLYVIDRQYRIQAWNRKREAETQGVSQDEAIGRNVFEVMRRQPRELLKREFDRVFETGRMEQMEMQSTASGERRYYRITKIPMRLRDVEVTHVITISEDITEWKAVHQQIAQTEKIAAVGKLAAGVMHEINNPLATIGACAEAVALRVNDLPAGVRESMEQYLRIIDSELDRCKSIVDGLLDFSRPKARFKKTIDLNQIVDDALFLVKHHDRFRGIILRRQLSEQVPNITANPEQLTQVFLALMLNALDSMEPGGTLTVKTSRSTEHPAEVVAELTDTGKGIPESDLPKIFEPFFTTKEPGQGTGLGLAICYGLVAQHRGRLSVDSQLGQGTTFRVFLPVSPGKQATPR